MDQAVVSMNWEILIVGGTVLLVFLGLIVRPLIKLNNTLTTLDLTLKNNDKTNQQSHQEIKDMLCKHGDVLEDHEYRIRIYERHQKVEE